MIRGATPSFVDDAHSSILIRSRRHVARRCRRSLNIRQAEERVLSRPALEPRDKPTRIAAPRPILSLQIHGAAETRPSHKFRLDIIPCSMRSICSRKTDQQDGPRPKDFDAMFERRAFRVKFVFTRPEQRNRHVDYIVAEIVIVPKIPGER
jgi:hypothetical protein